MTDIESSNAFEPVLEEYTWFENFESGSVGAWSSYPPAQDTAYDQTIWIKPLYKERDAKNRALYREVMPNYEVDYIFGVRKRLEMLNMYIDNSSCLSFKSYIKSFNGTEGVMVRFGFEDGTMAERMIPFKNCMSWVECTIMMSDILPKDTCKKISAVAFMAVCPKADPESLLRFGIDNVKLTGKREVPWKFNSPNIHKLEEWADFIAGKHFNEGEKITISGTPPAATSSASVRISHVLTGEDEKKFTMEQTDKGIWSVTIPLKTEAGIGAGFWRATIGAFAENKKITDTSLVFLVRLKSSTKSHPRLVFTPDEKKHILSRISSGHLKDVWEEHKKNARSGREKYSIDDFNLNVDAYDEIYWLPTYGFYYEPLRRPAKFVRENAVVYALSGDREAGDAARRALLKMMTWPTYNHPHLVNQGQFSYYPIGQALIDLSLGYDMIYDLLNPSENKTVHEALFSKMLIDLYKEYVRDNRVSSNTSNWTSHCTAGGILFLLAVLDEYNDEKLEPYLTGMILKMGELIRSTYDEDGNYGEGSSYCIFTMNTLALSMTSLERAFGVRFPEKLSKCYRFLLYQTDTEAKRIYDFGDTSAEFDGMTNFAYLIGKYRDPQIKWLYDLAPGSSDLDLFFLDESVEAKGPEGFPPVAWFKDVGTVIFRSGFGHEDFMFVFRCGPFYNHQHFDQGTFYLADRGGTFICETDESEGGDTISHYYSEPWYDKLFIQPGGHNCILVNGNPESQRAGDFLHDVPAWKDYATITDFINFNDGAFTSGRLDSLYKGKLKTLTRSIFYIKPRTILLIDEAVGTEDAESINLLFHSPRKEDITVKDREANIKRLYGTLSIYTAAPDTYYAKIKKRPLGLLEFASVYNREFPLKTRGFIELTSELKEEYTTFVNVLSTDNDLMSNLDSTSSPDHVAITIGESTYFVNTSGVKLYSNKDVTTDALVYTGTKDMYVAMRVRKLICNGKTMLSSDNPACIAFYDGKVNKVHYSVRKKTNILLSTKSEPRQITVNGSANNSWKYTRGTGLSLTLSEGTGVIEIT